MHAIDGAAFERRDPSPPLPLDEIHVWRFSVVADSPRAIGAAARETLLRLLAGYAGFAQAPVIAYGPHGKPYAPDLPDLDFNLSHAGNEVLFAFARRQALGIDLERDGRRLSIDGIARRFFASAEADALERLGECARRDAFLQLWTAKEAVLKALGEGLQFGLDRLEFSVGDDAAIGTLRRLEGDVGAPAEWQLRRLLPEPGLVGALAWRGPPRIVRAFTLET